MCQSLILHEADVRNATAKLPPGPHDADFGQSAVTVNDMAGEFGITRRQVYRDLAQIEEEGHPLERSDGTGERTWQLPLGYKGLPQIAISQYELMSLHLAKSHLAYLNGTPFVDDLDSVIAKVEAGLPARTANHLERIVRVFAPLQRGSRLYAGKKEPLLCYCPCPGERSDFEMLPKLITPSISFSRVTEAM